MSASYLIRPKADQDLDDLAYYFAMEASRELGHGFLVAAHETFLLLCTQPNLGWLSRYKLPELAGVRIFRLRRFEKILVLYRPVTCGVEILRVVHGARNIKAFLRREGVE